MDRNRYQLGFGDSADRVNNIHAWMRKTAAAIHAQTEGISLISNAIDEIDRITQANAAQAQVGAGHATQLEASASAVNAAVVALEDMMGGAAQGQMEMVIVSEMAAPARADDTAPARSAHHRRAA